MPLPLVETAGASAGKETPAGRFSSRSGRIKGFIAVSVSSCRSSLQGKFSDSSHCLGLGREGYHESNLADKPVSAASGSAIIRRTPAVGVTQGNATSLQRNLPRHFHKQRTRPAVMSRVVHLHVTAAGHPDRV